MPQLLNYDSIKRERYMLHKLLSSILVLLAASHLNALLFYHERRVKEMVHKDYYYVGIYIIHFIRSLTPTSY